MKKVDKDTGKILKINNKWSKIEKYQEAVRKDKFLTLVSEKIKGMAHVYAVMDHAVAFGYYENDKIKIAVANPDQHKCKLEELPLDYVQELRIFKADCELRIIRSEDSFCWRLRQDFDKAISGASNEYVLDELHKLWGAVPDAKKQEIHPIKGWSLLTSKRGSRIVISGNYDSHAEIGLKIRNYIAFHRAADGDGISHFVDERLMGFELWPSGQGKGEQ